MPVANPLGVPNRLWEWRGCQVRYQAMGEDNNGTSVLLVHGLLVNADHWRRNLPALAEAGLRVFAIDLLGSGYSDKPNPYSEEAASISGERGRNLTDIEVDLISGDGGQRRVSVPLAHPLGSIYNIYTWSEQLCDFIEEVMKSENAVLVGNSLGSLVSLQAALDKPQLVKGLMLVNPRFRQEHVSEAPALVKPFISCVQYLLRETPVGNFLFNSLITKSAVKTILEEPYCDTSQVTNELVTVLREPLLLKGADDVVFDVFSYSTGPLLEGLLQDERLSAPVWACWGAKDPWTPLTRANALDRFPAVKRLVEFPGVGHCPHDEAPDVVNPLIIEFAKGLNPA